MGANVMYPRRLNCTANKLTNNHIKNNIRYLIKKMKEPIILRFMSTV